jgi:hypothetical protein
MRGVLREYARAQVADVVRPWGRERDHVVKRQLRHQGARSSADRDSPATTRDRLLEEGGRQRRAHARLEERDSSIPQGCPRQSGPPTTIRSPAIPIVPLEAGGHLINATPASVVEGHYRLWLDT